MKKTHEDYINIYCSACGKKNIQNWDYEVGVKTTEEYTQILYFCDRECAENYVENK
jgi:hypothetical protein